MTFQGAARIFTIAYSPTKSTPKMKKLAYQVGMFDTTYEVAERIGRSNTRSSQKKLHFITEYITKHPADEK